MLHNSCLERFASFRSSSVNGENPLSKKVRMIRLTNSKLKICTPSLIKFSEKIAEFGTSSITALDGCRFSESVAYIVR
jgi:hypothetical protein